MKREILASTAQKRGISLDPRTKLALLVSIAVFVLGGSYAGAMQWVTLALSAAPLLFCTIGPSRMAVRAVPSGRVRLRGLSAPTRANHPNPS